MLARAQFLNNPPRQKIVPQWSLEEALSVLKKKKLRSLPPNEQFLITLFLVAIATGNRSSELASIDRKTIYFSPGYKEANLPVVPGFLFKNQSASRTPLPIVIPALGRGSILCPVAALRQYQEQTANSTSKKLFLNPDTGAPLNAGTISSWLCKSIKYLLPNVDCRGHDTRKVAFSMAWARGISAENIVKKGFWSSVNVFIKRYLVVPTEPPGKTPCIVAGHKV